MRWYLEALKKYAVFSGRARRKEYWMFALMNLLIAFVLGIVEGILGIASDSDESVLGAVYILATLIPGIAVGVRRMHDTDHSGWWLLVTNVNLIFAVQAGQHGPNRFGPDPKEPVVAGAAVAAGAVAIGYAPPLAQTGAPTAFCVRCGSRFPENAAYCPGCGAARTSS
jgi:uncharacterized membrane protein YhaH (DUF805 family)